MARPRRFLVPLTPLLLLGCAALVGCAKAEMAEPDLAARAAEPTAAETATAPAAEPGAPAPGDTSQAAPAPAVPARKLIRKVDLDLAVKDTQAAERKVEEIVKAHGGFVEALNARRAESLMHYELTLRFPADQLDAALAAIKALAVRVDREQLATEDATSRYVDLQSSLRTLTATETELRELLAESREKGRKVEDVMAVYRELTQIRGQIEQIQGQLQSIDRLAALSTVHLSLRSDVAAAPIVNRDEWRPWETVRSSAGPAQDPPVPARRADRGGGRGAAGGAAVLVARPVPQAPQAQDGRRGAAAVTPEMSLLLWVLGVLCVLVGIAGSVLPALPGTPLVLVGLVLAAWADGFQKVGWLPLCVIGGLTLVALAVDFVASSLGAKRAGASWMAVVGAALGTFVGLFFSLPGLILGPFVGAVLGEYLARRNRDQALKAGFATWLGILLGTAGKLVLIFLMIGVFAFSYAV